MSRNDERRMAFFWDPRLTLDILRNRARWLQMNSMGWLLLWVWIGIRILFIAAVVYFVIVEIRRYRSESSQPKDET